MDSTQRMILASASARRKDLLTKAGYRFDIVASKIDESTYPTDGIAPVDYAKQLALAKAQDVANDYPDRLVIGADTIADFDGSIIGKAADENHAEQITRILFSAPHKVITAVALVRLSDNTQLIGFDATTVYPKKMTDEQIATHVRGGTWKGKAGAYAIQETGDEFVERIEGSLTNVMGLPMELLQKMLARLGIGPSK